MTISEFAASRGVMPQVISIFIKRHPKEFKGHIIQKGKSKELDEVALGVLDTHYPLPAPVQVIEDTESRKELIKTQKLIIQLQERLQDATMQIAEAEATKMLLEDKQGQLDKAEETIGKLSNEVDQLRLALELEKNKSWIQKLLKK